MTTLIAHRGASAEAPENTLAAIKRAIELSVDCIEIDLHLTKDGVPVVIHDSTLKRTTDASAPTRIEELTIAEVKSLDAGMWFSPAFKGERIPTLQEVLELDRKGARLMLEVKKGTAPAELLTDKIRAVLPKEDPSIHLASFEPDIIKALQNSSYALIGIVENPPFIKTFLDMGLKHLALWSHITEPHQLAALKEGGVSVWAFTVDDVKTARFLQSIGVDGLITNNPQHIRENALRGNRASGV